MNFKAKKMIIGARVFPCALFEGAKKITKDYTNLEGFAPSRGEGWDIENTCTTAYILDQFLA